MTPDRRAEAREIGEAFIRQITMTPQPTWDRNVVEWETSSMDTAEVVNWLTDRISQALTRAHADGVREGLERAVQKADQWASSASCQFHDDNPCCHVRTGAGIAAAIRALIPGEGG